MVEKIVKVIDENGNVSFQKCQLLNIITLKDGNYGFKNLHGERVIPTDEELEQFNNQAAPPVKIENGWLTFMGLLTVFSLVIFLLYLVLSKGS